ncbi:hypothetical protein EKM02_10185 [Flavobacterium sp. RSP49]|uniref:hypothetical protein n=1 Tax=Flavobacterium sp. RSP49 TaxID=2497487 RepID=UPI000F84AD66|nr:hypothetical protein [Flavobacterium sp. RSP49]RTY99453.1 hypothetical protein EKM02_10185 [Flavobacterium sp. RSP49]
MNKENRAVDSILVQDFKGNQIDLIKEYQGKPVLDIIYNNQCFEYTRRAIPLAYQLQKENIGVQNRLFYTLEELD